MESQHRERPVVVRKHVGRPGPWTQMPMILLGMLFVAAVLISGYQRSLAANPDLGGPSGGTTRIENPVPSADLSSR